MDVVDAAARDRWVPSPEMHLTHSRAQLSGGATTRRAGINRAAIMLPVVAAPSPSAAVGGNPAMCRSGGVSGKPAVPAERTAPSVSIAVIWQARPSSSRCCQGRRATSRTARGPSTGHTRWCCRTDRRGHRCGPGPSGGPGAAGHRQRQRHIRGRCTCTSRSSLGGDGGLRSAWIISNLEQLPGHGLCPGLRPDPAGRDGTRVRPRRNFPEGRQPGSRPAPGPRRTRLHPAQVLAHGATARASTRARGRQLSGWP